jgi:pimeloyl-ACP methyl ester carboxylesterase
MSKTIVLIHGAWLNSRSWDGFKDRYEKAGYTVIAPDWPSTDARPPNCAARRVRNSPI